MCGTDVLKFTFCKRAPLFRKVMLTVVPLFTVHSIMLTGVTAVMFVTDLSLFTDILTDVPLLRSSMLTDVPLFTQASC